jgi:hypothetical protein
MANRMTIRKWFWVWDYEKEERWLNEMAESGWALVGVGFATYHFEQCEPGEYIIRLEMHDPDSSYLSFMEETGAEYIGRFMKWIFFRRKSELGAFDLFSDLDSKLNHLKSIHRMVLMFGAANLCIGVGNSLNATRVGWLNLLVCALLMYGAGVMKGKIDYLEGERMLRE